MKKIPAIAQLRHREAIAKFGYKLEVLERLITDGTLDRFPKKTSISSFASWVDSDLGVQSLSRSVIYDENKEYLIFRQRMEHLLNLVEKARTKEVKKVKIENELRRKLALAEERAQAYVNQYSIAMVELSEAHKEIERLKNKIHRQSAGESRATQFHLVKNSPGVSE